MESSSQQMTVQLLGPSLRRMPTLRQRLEFLRNHQRMSVADTAQSANISITAAYNLERGGLVSIETLELYARALDTPVDCLTAGLDMSQIVSSRPKGRSARPQREPKGIGKRIRELRRQRCMSQAELAKRSFRSQTNISQIELGQCVPCQRTLRFIASAFSIKLEDLMNA